MWIVVSTQWDWLLTAHVFRKNEPLMDVKGPLAHVAQDVHQAMINGDPCRRGFSLRPLKGWFLCRPVHSLLVYGILCRHVEPYGRTLVAESARSLCGPLFLRQSAVLQEQKLSVGSMENLEEGQGRTLVPISRVMAAESEMAPGFHGGLREHAALRQALLSNSEESSDRGVVLIHSLLNVQRGPGCRIPC